ncbi:PAS domain-containing protein [Desulfobulbus sp.]|uniref:PAS domain-containing protein n=1 Tax=Desulfobulbus sp. TaxID=895 RepID=UPI00286EF2A9|nr:PAS domain-containing protein [Desulfobulbus sp.]
MSADELDRQRVRQPQTKKIRRDMAETAPELTVRLNREGRVVALLPPVRMMPGLIAEELIGRHYLDFVRRRERDRAQQAVALLLNGAHAIELVLRIRRNGGKSARVGVRATPWYEGERLAGVQGALRLILGPASAQPGSEGAFPGFPASVPGGHGGSLGQGRAVQKLLNTAAVGLGILRRGRFLYLNEQLSRMTGYEAETLLGRDWKALFFEAMDGTGASDRPPAGADGERTAKARWLRADGKIAEVRLSLVPLEAGDGWKPGDVALTAIDLGPETQADGLLQSVGSELDICFQTAVPLCLLSLDCQVMQVNRAFADFFRCSPEEAVGSPCAALWGCESCGDEECIVRQMQAGRTHGSYVLDKVVGRRHVACMFHTVPCRDEAGRLSGVLVAFFESHKLDKMSVDFQTIRRQLVQAERLSAIGALAASIAHEFNNPLCGIRAVIERTARKTAGADRSLLQMALDNCDHMSGLIRNLQQFNLPFSDERLSFDLHHAIDSVLILLDKYLKIRKTSVVKECGDAPLLLCGCESQIKQMVLNLIKSRGEAMPEEGGEIRIRTDHNGDKIRIVLSDTGNSIRQEHLPHLFEPFCSSANPAGENGFGLSVSHDIVKAHGGDIVVESAPGQGAVFTVTLPIGIQS